MGGCTVVNDPEKIRMNGMESPLITLFTDFGYADAYVGVMKGVIHRIYPQARIADLTHGIPPGEIGAGAFALLSAYRYFPQGTIFVCVIDPGVGSSRKAMAPRAGGYTFIAPDNGLLSYIVQELGGYEAVALTNTDYQLGNMSATFHGRDVFAPAGAHLANGAAFESFGERLSSIVQLPEPQCKVGRKYVTGEIVYIDQFGNAITSIGRIERSAEDRLTLTPLFGKKREPFTLPANPNVKFYHWNIPNISHTYADGTPDQMIALIGSSGFLELALNQDNFAFCAGAQIGDQVQLIIG